MEVRAFQTAEGDSPFLDWLEDLRTIQPRAYSKCHYLLSALEQHGPALRRPLADSLRDGIHEMRAKVGRVNYRILYGFVGKQVAIVSHGITKKDSVPDSEIELAIRRIALVKENPDKYTTSLPDEEL